MKFRYSVEAHTTKGSKILLVVISEHSFLGEGNKEAFQRKMGGYVNNLKKELQSQEGSWPNLEESAVQVQEHLN